MGEVGTGRVSVYVPIAWILKGKLRPPPKCLLSSVPGLELCRDAPLLNRKQTLCSELAWTLVFINGNVRGTRSLQTSHCRS